MLVIIVILLFFGVVVRHKWKDAAAKTEEILKLVAVEEAEIARLQSAEDVYSKMNAMNQTTTMVDQGEKKYYCAVCHSAATTRCSQCKAVRYCSGKCQIIHWRQGHREECRPSSELHANKEGGNVVGRASDSHLKVNLVTNANNILVLSQEHEDSGSSRGSSPCLLSSSEQSEPLSFNASNSEVLELDTPIAPDKAIVVSHILQTTSVSDDAGVPSPLTSSYTENSTPLYNNVGRIPTFETDERRRSKSFKAKRKGNESSGLDESVQRTTELGSLHVSASVRTSLAGDQRNQAILSTGKATKSMSVRDSGSHQLPNAKLSPHLSKSLKMPPSDEFRRNESKLYNESEDNREFSMPGSRDMKTSVQKFAQHYEAPKQSKTFTLDLQKETGENYAEKVIFPLKLFRQLYYCDEVNFRPFGFVNCGNSCYANALLQCLIVTRPLTSYLLQGLHSRTCHKRGWCFICKLESLILMGQELNTPLSPVGLVSQIQSIGKEEDAHEFLRNVVDKMQSIFLEEAGVSDSLADDSTLIGLTFGGYLRSKIKCMRCSGMSERCERMMDLTVEIDGNIHTLEEALAQFTTSETLGGDDKYKCSKCKSYEKAKKKLSVSEAPNILTIVLKRFQSGNLDKLNKIVRFPEILNLSAYMSRRTSDKCPMYHLYAVVVHMGVMNAADTGHYVSYVKDFRRHWFAIDDSRVCPVDLKTVLSVDAYILFYARDTPRVPSFARNVSTYSDDGKTKRTFEAISSSNGVRKRIIKTNPVSNESTTRVRGSEKNPRWMSPNDFAFNHMEDNKGYHTMHKNPFVDSSSSDSSSIFSVSSDGGSYSTDSTKDSSTEEIPGYIFGSRWYDL